MNLKDILAECQSQGWVPVLLLRTNEKTLIPCFNSQEKAIKFAKRNLPKDQIFGTTCFTEEDIQKIEKEWIAGKGWALEKLDHPRLMKNLGEFDVEVFEFFEKPEVYGVWGNKCQTTKLISKS